MNDKIVIMQPYERHAILFLLKHLASGAAGALVLGSGLLYFDVAQLATLAARTEGGLISVLMLYFGLIVTFGGVAMGIGIMSLAED